MSEDSVNSKGMESPASPATNTKLAWQRANFRRSKSQAVFSNDVMDKITEDKTLPVKPLSFNKRLSISDPDDRKKSECRDNLSAELDSTLKKLNELQTEYLAYRTKMDEVEIRANRLYHDNRRLQLDLHEKADDIKRLHRDLDKKKDQIDSLKSDLKKANEKARGISNMEWKAMEYEKVNIMNENLKQKLENYVSQNRDLERKLRERDKQLEEKDTIIKSNNNQISELDEKMQDLRLQVREEAIINSKLDKKLEILSYVQKQLEQKEEEILNLNSKLEETEALLIYAKQAWREEREKVKKYEDEDKAARKQNEEVALTLSENATLKSLVVAKDTILIHKSQILNNIKHLVQTHDRPTVGIIDLKDILESEPHVKSTFPLGNKTKEQLMESDSSSSFLDYLEKTSKSNDTSVLPADQRNKSSARIATGRRPKTAVVHPQSHFLSTSFSNFRSDSADTFQSNFSNADTKSINIPEELFDSESSDIKSKPEQNKNKVQNKKSESRKGGQKVSPVCRAKSMNNRISPQSSHAPDTLTNSAISFYSQKSSTVIGSTGINSIPAAIIRMSPKRDMMAASVVRKGDRVYIDMSKSKDKRKSDYHSAIIKFIGNVDKEYDCYRIYIGVKLDEPIGDTDGIYKGKRYFKVPSLHGKFLRITKIVSVYNQEKRKYEFLEDLQNDFETADMSNNNV